MTDKYSNSNSELRFAESTNRTIIKAAEKNAIFKLAILASRMAYLSNRKKRIGIDEIIAAHLQIFKMLTTEECLSETQLVAYGTTIAVNPKLLLAAIEHLVLSQTSHLTKRRFLPLTIAKICLLAAFATNPDFIESKKSILTILRKIEAEYPNLHLSRFVNAYKDCKDTSKEGEDENEKRKTICALLDLPQKLWLPDEIIRFSYLDNNINDVTSAIVELLQGEAAICTQAVVSTIFAVRNDLSDSYSKMLSIKLFEIIKEDYLRETLKPEISSRLISFATQEEYIREIFIKMMADLLTSFVVLKDEKYDWFNTVIQQLIEALAIPTSDNPKKAARPLFFDNVISALSHFWKIAVNSDSKYGWMYILSDNLELCVSTRKHDIGLIEQLLKVADIIEQDAMYQTNFKELLGRLYKEMRAGLLPRRRRSHFGLSETT